MFIEAGLFVKDGAKATDAESTVLALSGCW